jgi:hypothetical protein
VAVRAVVDDHHVDVRVVATVAGKSRADFEDQCFRRAAVLEVMPVGGACLKACGVARAQRFLAGICYQNDFPADDVDELVACDLPVSLA